MNVLQIILIALFIYLGSIGSIVGNTIGWYGLGRPLVASFIVGLIMGDVGTAMVVGIPLQIMYMGNVTPGGAVAWDLSYATYIGTAGALAFGQGMGTTELIGLSVVFAGIGGLVGLLSGANQVYESRDDAFKGYYSRLDYHIAQRFRRHDGFPGNGHHPFLPAEEEVPHCHLPGRLHPGDLLRPEHHGCGCGGCDYCRAVLRCL